MYMYILFLLFGDELLINYSLRNACNIPISLMQIRIIIHTDIIKIDHETISCL